MDNIFLIQYPSAGNWRSIFLGKAWDRTKEALFLRTAAATVTEGVGLFMGLCAALTELLNSLYLYCFHVWGGCRMAWGRSP